MKTFKKWFNRFISLVFVIVFLFASYVMVTVIRAGKKEVPIVFGYGLLRVATGSMEPTIKTGSLIVVKETDPELVKIGDIICFYSEDPAILGYPNTHRVDDIVYEDGKKVFYTRGDATDIQDKYTVSAENIVGVMIDGFSNMDKLAKITGNKYFFFFALLIPLCGVVFIEGLNVIKILKTKDEKPEQDDAEEDENEKDRK